MVWMEPVVKIECGPGWTLRSSVPTYLQRQTWTCRCFYPLRALPRFLSLGRLACSFLSSHIFFKKKSILQFFVLLFEREGGHGNGAFPPFLEFPFVHFFPPLSIHGSESPVFPSQSKTSAKKNIDMTNLEIRSVPCSVSHAEQWHPPVCYPLLPT